MQEYYRTVSPFCQATLPPSIGKKDEGPGGTGVIRISVFKTVAEYPG